MGQQMHQQQYMQQQPVNAFTQDHLVGGGNMGGGNMGKQLKYADRRESPVAVIEGEDERASGVVQLKDLALGARLAADIETHEDWKAQPAQIEVARGELVTEVRKMIARAG